jgi:hypothetical protein
MQLTAASWPQREGHGAKSEAVRERAVAALLGERSIARAAKRSGLNEGTLRRWLTEDEAFKTAYAIARRAIFNESMDRIQIVARRAVETLEDLLSATKHPSVRLGAAHTIVELGLHQQDAETTDAAPVITRPVPRRFASKRPPISSQTS